MHPQIGIEIRLVAGVLDTFDPRIEVVHIHFASDHDTESIHFLMPYAIARNFGNMLAAP
ncbi:MAG: hypothetical protein ACJAVT_001988 [Yoonia sp.]|jgi:hypothetical protein